MEAYWGSRKFFFYYIICGLGAGFCQELAQFGQFYIICNEQVPGFTFADTMMVVRANQGLLNLWTTVGCLGCALRHPPAYGMYSPQRANVCHSLPLPPQGQVGNRRFHRLELFSAIATTNDGVAHLAHLGGMLFGYILIKYWRKHPFMEGNGFGKHGGGWQNTGHKRKNWGGFGKNWGGFDVLKGKKTQARPHDRRPTGSITPTRRLPGGDRPHPRQDTKERLRQSDEGGEADALRQ